MEVQRIIASSNSHQGVGHNQGFAQPKEVNTCTQIFQATKIIEPTNTALTTFRESSAAAMLQNASKIDPREQMIEELEDQNQLLITEMVKAAQIYDENQAEKNKTIASQAKCIEELSAGHIHDQARIQELTLLLDAQSKAHKEDLENRIKLQSEEANKIIVLCNEISLCQEQLPKILDYLALKSFNDNFYDYGGGDFQLISGRYSGWYSTLFANAKSNVDPEFMNRVKDWKLYDKYFPDMFTEETIAKVNSIKERMESLKKESKT